MSRSRRLLTDPVTLVALLGVLGYLILCLLVMLGVIGADYDARVGAKFLPPGPGHWLGTDRQGRDILVRAVYAVKVACLVGAGTSAIAVIMATVLGSLAGYFGGKVDAFIVWLYSTIQSVPSLLLLIAISYVAGKGLFGVYLALTATFWTGPCRIIRGEVLKLRDAEFVEAARVIGLSPLRILGRHIVPNTMHLVFVNFGLLFVAAIKSEVILSYLGLGVRGEPSWGTMIDQARAELINGFYWQIGAASVLMFGLVLSLNFLSDGIADAFDAKTHG